MTANNGDWKIRTWCSFKRVHFQVLCVCHPVFGRQTFQTLAVSGAVFQLLVWRRLVAKLFCHVLAQMIGCEELPVKHGQNCYGVLLLT